MYFASDNSSPVPSEVMDALQRANQGYARAYGADAIMDEVRARIREVFEAPEAAVHLVATGTAANALALACFCPPWAAVYCHRMAHIEEDECGAPEFYTGGAKLVLLDGADARIAPESLRKTLQAAAQVGVHNVQRGMLSLTNATEAGAVYSPRQVAELTAIAREHGVPCHMDGARFANALVAAGCTPAEMTWKAGIDVLSFGGTKNGLMGVEAVVIFDPAKSWEFELRRKRGGHLFSKHRYLAAQMQAYLADDLWLRLATQANAAGRRFSKGLAGIPGARLLHPTEANMVFAAFPRTAHQRARAAGAAYYFWPFDQSLEGPGEELLSARMVASWCTGEEDIARFLDLLRG
jgi:threonine aldolase